MTRWLASFLIALPVLAATARPAHAADAAQQQLAQALFDEGRRLMDEGRFSEACPKLAESQRLDPGGGTILNLALCHEREGKLATAKAEYEEALRLAVQARRADREALARQRIAALERRIPRLTIVVSAEAASLGLEIELDGRALPREAWGVPMGVDPGARAIEATANGYERWSSSVTLEPEQKETVEVPALEPAHRWVGAIGARRGPVDAPQPPRVESEAAPPAEPDPSKPDPRISAKARLNPLYGLASTLVVVGAGTATATGTLALVQRLNANGGCIPERSYCFEESAKDAAGRSATLAWISTISLGVALVGGVGMLVLPVRASEPSVRPSASVGPGGGSLGLSGVF